MPALSHGDMVMIDTGNPAVLAWRRDAPGGAAVVVAINMTDHPAKLNLGAASTLDTMAVSDGVAPARDGAAVTLAPFVSWVAKGR